MQYTITDLEGDHIMVVPGDKDGVTAKVVIVFATEDDDEFQELAMLLDDRRSEDLITAIRGALKESERIG